MVSDEFGKLLDRFTAYRVKERPSSVTEILLDLGIGKKVFNPVNNSGVYSFKAEELNGVNRVTIPYVNTKNQATKTTSSVSEFEFEYVKTSLVKQSSGFLGLGTKATVELDRKQGKAQYIREDLGNEVAT